MDENVKEIPPEGRHFPWSELILYILGGFGVFSLVSFGLSVVSKALGQWSILGLAVINVCFIGGSAWYLGVRRGKTSWQAMGFWPAPWKWNWAVLAIGLSLLLMPLRGLMGLLASYLLEGGIDSLQARADLLLGGAMNFSWLGFALTFICVGFIVPVSEELYFRGLLHRLLQTRLVFWLRVLASSALFGLAHFDSIGVVISSFIMGIVLAIAYERSKSLWLPIAIHIATNSIAVAILYLWLLIHHLFFSNLPPQLQ